MSSAADSAKPLFSDTFIMRLDCKGELTVTSKAAGWPAFHACKKISPVWSYCRVVSFSVHRWQIPSKMIYIILFRIRSWREIISPRRWRDTAWSPITSRVPDLKKGHFRSRTILYPVDIWEQQGTQRKIGVVPELEWGLRITRHQSVVEKGNVSELLLLWNFVFLTSCRRLSYQVPPEFFFERDVIAILLTSPTALANEVSSAGLWTVNFSTRTEDWKTDPTYAAWTWSADRLIPTPILLIGRHA